MTRLVLTRPGDKTVAAIAEGRQLVAEKNCKGCHLIEGAGGDNLRQRNGIPRLRSE